jgi:hypothetical protein
LNDLSKAGHSPAAVSERISLLLLLRQYKLSVSKASQRTFGLSTGVIFASNDSKTYFEQRKNAR